MKKILYKLNIISILIIFLSFVLFKINNNIIFLHLSLAFLILYGISQSFLLIKYKGIEAKGILINGSLSYVLLGIIIISILIIVCLLLII